MTTLTAQTTVGEIAAQHPAAARVFERYRIDYCCGGKLPLDTACRANGVTPEALLEEIERSGATAATERDWSRASLADLIDHILDVHHAFLRAELPWLAAKLEKVQEKHGGRYPAIAEVAQVFQALHAELDSHMMKEEMVLFPLIRRMEAGHRGPSHCGSVQNPIRVMVMEHDSAGDALARLRSLTGGFVTPEDACATFQALYRGLEELERDLHRHIHLENNVLFPRAVELD